MTADLAARVRALGSEASSWSNGPHDTYAAHEHGYDKTLVCARGSITFGLVAEGRAVEMHAGDRLDLPAGTQHDALVGDEGVTCFEGHFSAGRHVAISYRRAGEW